DTAAWLALLNSADIWHQKAQAIRSELTRTGCLFITTDFVLLFIPCVSSRLFVHVTCSTI
ncbi:MAG: hypothetical protein AAGL17_04390, partial [Cyanobacteria bacterium J06576_12]